MQTEYLEQRIRMARCCKCRKQASYVMLSDPMECGDFLSTRVHCIACDKFHVFRCVTEAESRKRQCRNAGGEWWDVDLVGA